MSVRKQISGQNRLVALGYGLLGLFIALLIAHAEFEWSGAVAFVIGLVGVGGIYRCVVGWDEL
ncbi:MAG: hypothetical protein AAGG56_05595 [Pseudomonadota bacterium]